MTHDPDIERVLDHWVMEGPTQMPRRFLDETLERIDRAPQHRLARLRTRLPSMSPDLRIAVAAAVVLAAVGLGAAALTQTRGVGSPSSAGSGVLPGSLQAEWHPVGTRQHPRLAGGTGQDDLDIVIDPTTITIFEWHGDVHNSASIDGTDRLDIRMLDDPVVQWPLAGGGTEPRAVWHCQVGDAGTYTYHLSSGDRLLTLTPVNDACSERATILAGDWTRTELGDIATGPHVSEVFRPFGGGTSGQLSYNVPTGWSAYEVTPGGLSLQIPVVTIRLFSDVVPVSNSPDPGCAASPADAIQHSPAAIAAWLAGHSGLVVSTPAPVAIGGLSGVMVDASVDPAVVSCSGLFVDFNDALVSALSGETQARYILLDRGDGQILLIAIETPNRSTWDAAIANAMPVVQAFEFTR